MQLENISKVWGIFFFYIIIVYCMWLIMKRTSSSQNVRLKWNLSNSDKWKNSENNTWPKTFVYLKTKWNV